MSYGHSKVRGVSANCQAKKSNLNRRYDELEGEKSQISPHAYEIFDKKCSESMAD